MHAERGDLTRPNLTTFPEHDKNRPQALAACKPEPQPRPAAPPAVSAAQQSPLNPQPLNPQQQQFGGQPAGGLAPGGAPSPSPDLSTFAYHGGPVGGGLSGGGGGQRGPAGGGGAAGVQQQQQDGRALQAVQPQQWPPVGQQQPGQQPVQKAPSIMRFAKRPA